MTTAGLLALAALPMIGAMSPEPGRTIESPSRTPVATIESPSRMPVAIAQPLAAMDRAPLVATPGSGAMLPESGMLVLVGSALLGLGLVVRKTTRDS
jgi:hypothetical protein